jgi:hypothetical protein
LRVKEEPLSDNEDIEDVNFKRTAKIKASFVIRRYCETGGDNDNDEEVRNKSDGEEYIPEQSSDHDICEDTRPVTYLPPPVILNQETRPPVYLPVPSPLVETLFHRTMLDVDPSSPYASTPSSNDGFPMETMQYSDPLEFRPSMVSPTFSMSNTETEQTNYPSPISNTNTMHTNNYSHTDNSTTHRRTANASLREPGARLVSGITPQHLSTTSDDKIKTKISRVVFLVRKLVDVLNLQPPQVHEYVEALIAKAVVFTIRESYSGRKPDALMLEKQINDLTEIVLNDMPYEQLVSLLCKSRNTTDVEPFETVEVFPQTTSFSPLSSTLSMARPPLTTKPPATAKQKPPGSKPKIASRAVTPSVYARPPAVSPNIYSHPPPSTMLIPSPLGGQVIHPSLPQVTILQPHQPPTMLAPVVQYVPGDPSSPITFGQHALLESMHPPTMLSTSGPNDVEDDKPTMIVHTNADTITHI